MTEQRNRLRLISHFPGRLRARAETFRLSPDVANDVVAHLETEHGVRQAKVSPVTGSLLVLYEPRELQLPRLVQILVRLGGLAGIEVDVDESWVDRASQGERVRARAGGWNDDLRRLTRGHADLRVAVPGALAATGLAMLVAGRRRIPEWYDLMFWAFVTFSNLNRPDQVTDDREA